MIRTLTISMLVLLSAFTIHGKKKKIVFFGDSITQGGAMPGGYITIMNDMLKQRGEADKYELIGAGIGGNKVYDLYLRMDEDVIKKKPDIVVIWVGVNDVWHKALFGTGTDPEKFEKFYAAIIKKLQDRKIKVYLCTPAVLGEKTDSTNEMDPDMNKFSNIIRKLAKDHKCGLIDLRNDFLQYELENNKENKEKGILTVDGVHPTLQGHHFVAEKMMEALITER